MGHWKHSRRRGDPGCDHVFVDETPARQRCAACAAARWWQAEHARGSVGAGSLTQEYELRTAR